MPPKSDSELKFTDHHKTITPAYVVYADYESLLQPTENDSKPQIHLPAAAAYIIIPANPDLRSPLHSVYKEFCYGR